MILSSVLDLNAAAARGEYYPALVEEEVAFEVPVPVSPRSEDIGTRTLALRVPMRLRSSD